MALLERHYAVTFCWAWNYSLGSILPKVHIILTSLRCVLFCHLSRAATVPPEPHENHEKYNLDVAKKSFDYIKLNMKWFAAKNSWQSSHLRTSLVLVLTGKYHFLQKLWTRQVYGIFNISWKYQTNLFGQRSRAMRIVKISLSLAKSSISLYSWNPMSHVQHTAQHVLTQMPEVAVENRAVESTSKWFSRRRQFD